MGQKINPVSFRLAFNKNWQSQWYEKKKDFAKTLQEDIIIRKLLDKHLNSKAGIAKVIIKRTVRSLQVIIYTARPGMVIGKGGSGTEQLKVLIEKITKNQAVQIVIEEVKKPELEAQIVANTIASQLERRIPFRRVIRSAVENSIKAGAKGAKVAVAGRLNGAEMARREKYHEGSIPLQTLKAKISYAQATAHTVKGSIGVKVWIFGGDK